MRIMFIHLKTVSCSLQIKHNPDEVLQQGGRRTIETFLFFTRSCAHQYPVFSLACRFVV
ncbi:hypothetical protein BIW11_10780 [Tropilaelaps mercedesae]|uniref:Uncharacterized protein n=1 Tax=Tropilaelaps mercedesae TaxID=418985 RepID=A0A1V9XEK1_9ACAR|nr:hypothetical protein BIW11_10780 [Tropilaelaps mercedesae]